MASDLRARLCVLFLLLVTASGARAGAGPAVVSATALNFGSQFTGTSSAAQIVTLQNTSAYTMYQSSFTIVGANAPDFTVATSCGTLVNDHSGCSVIVVFRPSTLGSETAALSFFDIDGQFGASYSQSIVLLGTGVPAAVPSTGALDLASAFSGGPSSTRVIAVNNAGPDPLNQGSFLLSGPDVRDFIVTTTCGTTFAAAGACTVSVLFTPTTATNETATLTFTDSDAATGIPYTQSIRLNGIVTAAPPTGIVEIIGKHSGKALDVLEASTTDGAPIEQHDFIAASGQQWQLVPVENGYYKIQNIHSGKVLDVILASNENGAGVQQWTYLGTDNQKWQLTPLPDGSFEIENKGSGKLLDVTGLSMQDGAPMQQWARTGGDNQKWMITARQYFSITSRNSDKVLDVTGYSLQDGGMIQQWTPLGAGNQLWQFVPLGNGYYEIVNQLSGKALDAIDPTGSPVRDGTLVQQYSYVGGDNQQWQLVSAGGGYYTIANKTSGKVLDVIGLSTSDGSAIQVYTYLGGNNQQWRLDLVSP